MGLGLVAAALSGAGNSIAQSAQDYQKYNDTMDLDQERANLQLEAQKRIAEYNQQLQNAPANRLGALVQTAAQTPIPVAAAPVTTPSGIPTADPSAAPDGTVAVNLPASYGNYQELRNKISMAPDSATRAAALDILDKQFKADQDRAQAAVDGKTRAPSNTEALQAAAQAALSSGDIQAYQAAKAAMGDKFVTLPDGGTLFDSTTGQIVAQSTGKQDRQDQREDRHDARQQEAEDARAARQEKTLQAIADRRDSANQMTQSQESNAQAIASGRLPPITGLGLRSPGASNIMARVLEINPDYDAKAYATGAKAEKDFATGKQGNAVRSFNVALSHLDTLSHIADALDNNDTQALNRLGNFISTQTGSPAPTNFDAVKHIVGDEIVKAITGSGGALGDREAAAKTLDRANSPAQLQGVINSYKELMVGQLSGMRDQYKATTGLDDFDKKYLSPAARSVAPATGSTVANPFAKGQTGSAGARPSLDDIFGQ